MDKKNSDLRKKKLVFRWLDSEYGPVDVIEDNYYQIDKKLVFDKNQKKLIVIILNKDGSLFKMSIEDDIVETLIELFDVSEFEVKGFIKDWILEKLKLSE